MTVKEFYEYCKEARIENYELTSAQISKNGCYIGEREVKPGIIRTDHEEKTISI